MGLVAFAALTLHSLVDGLAVAASFGASAGLGLVAAFVVTVHEFPEGLSMAAIALGAGYGRQRAFLLSLVVALATPLGRWLPTRGYKVSPTRCWACSWALLPTRSSTWAPQISYPSCSGSRIGAFSPSSWWVWA